MRVRVVACLASLERLPERVMILELFFRVLFVLSEMALQAGEASVGPGEQEDTVMIKERC
jgi:hypothetical protein